MTTIMVIDLETTGLDGIDEGDKLGRARAALNKNPNSTEALAALFAAM